jgi:hypothetical protein
MATTPKVLLKRSSVIGRVPSAGDLEYGELAINFADGKIYYKDASNSINAFVDSARVQAIANAVEATAQAQLDSSEVTALIDSAYVQARQDYDWNSLENIPSYVISLDSAEIARLTLDSAEITSLIDSSHVRTRQDYAYSSLTGTPYIPSLGNDYVDSAYVTSLPVSTFTNDANYLDSSTVTGVIDAVYITGLIDTTYLDSAETIALIDSSYIRAKIDKAFIDGLNIDADTVDGQDGSWYLDWTNTTNKPVILDIVDVQSIIDSDHVQARIDQAYISSLNPDADTVDGYHAQAFFDAIDSAVNALVDGAPGALDTLNELAQALNDDSNAYNNLLALIAAQLDSAEAIALIDSAYIRARQDYAYSSLTGVPDIPAIVLANSVDSGEVINLIDSTYVQARQINYTGFDSDFATKSTSDLTEGTNLYYTKARADSDIATSLNDSGNTVNITINNTITDTVDSAYVLARIAEAPFLDSADAIALIDSAYILARSPAGIDSALVVQIIDSAYVAARTSAGTDSATVVTIINDTVDSAYISALGFGTGGGTVDSAAIIALVDSAYIQARQTDVYRDSGFVTALVDSAYIQLRDRFQDSSGILAIVDSAYVQARASTGTDSATVISLIESANDSDRTNRITARVHRITSLSELSTLATHTGLGVPNGTAKVGDIAYNLNPFDGYVLTDIAATAAYQNSGFHVQTGNGTVTRMDFDVVPSGQLPSDNFAIGSTIAQNSGGGDVRTVTAVSDTGGNYSKGYLDFTPSDQGYAPGWDNKDVWVSTANQSTWKTFGIDSADIINLIDSAYIQARQTSGGGGTVDSAYVLSVVDSAAVPFSQTFYHFTADSGQLTFSGFDDDSDTLAYTAGALAVYLNGILLVDSIDYTASDGTSIILLDSAVLGDVLSILKFGGNSVGVDSAAVINLIDSDYVRLQTRIGDSDIDFGSNKILYSNVYSTEGDLPSASNYHGMFAHVHGTGAGYFAHAGNWVKLANYADINPYSDAHVTTLVDSAYIALRDRFQDSAGISAIVDSAYVQARQTSGGGGTVDSADIIAIVDSAYVQLRQSTVGGGGGGTDSASVITLINATVDSDYIGTKVDFTRGEFVNEKSQFTATAAQTIFNHSSIDPTHLDVYLNGILQVVNDDYTATSSAVTFTSGVDSGYSVTIVEKRGRVLTQRGLVESKYYFTTPTPITSITGTDDNSNTLDYSSGFLDVYLNGILLKDSDDYSTNAGTTVTLVSATDSNDLVTLINRKGVVVTPNVKNYEFTATAGQTTFSGADINGNTLAYVPGAAQVFLNGILIRNVDYTGITGTSIVLVDSASLNDELVVSAFSNPGQNMDLYKFTADSGQTIFSGNDLTGASLAYQPGNIQVFMNGLLLNDSDDYSASNGMSIVLTSGADLSDEIKIASFVSNADVIRTNAWTAPSGTPVTATAGDKLFIDVSSSAKTVTLPSSASMGDEIRIIDITGNAATNNITVGRNGHKIQGSATDLTININRAGIGLVYYNAAQGWVLIEN